MVRSTRRLVLVFMTVVLIITSCRGGATNSDPVVPTVTVNPGGSVTSTLPAPMVTSDTQSPLPLTPNPASIDITLDEGSAATATIGAEGGSIELTDVNGTEYTLTIPEDALFSPEEITMTPIASAEGKAIGKTFLAGVSLQPEGLHFLELVNIEISGGKIDENALAFAAESGGQDFHLTPSKPANGVTTISTTHFSDFGVSLEEVGALVDLIVPLADRARIEHDLTIGSDQQALVALERMIESLLAAGEIENFEQWNPWTAQVVTLFLRASEAADRRGWNANTPGFTDLTREMQNLIDQWFQQSEEVIQGLADKCVQGEIENFLKVSLIFRVGNWFDDSLNLERGDVLFNWYDMVFGCGNLVLTWQANVVTTGDNFFSDISIGSEIQTTIDDGMDFRNATLGVEYINGFWQDTCVPKSGTVQLRYDINWESGQNLNSGDIDYNNSIKDITAYVKIVKPVYIDCSPSGFKLDADAQFPFHGGALEKLNQDRVGEDGGWEFEMKYDPGGGVVAQFEQGPENKSYSDVKYELWQLVSLYNIASPN